MDDMRGVLRSCKKVKCNLNAGEWLQYAFGEQPECDLVASLGLTRTGFTKLAGKCEYIQDQQRMETPGVQRAPWLNDKTPVAAKVLLHLERPCAHPPLAF